jgi:NTP pyrophosphatase (non-canonical NTP hydrolase)
MNRIKTLANHNGTQTIKALLIDEAKELIEAIEQNYDYIQEIADVFNLCYQLMYSEGTIEELDKQLDYKINRAIKRLNLKEEL